MVQCDIKNSIEYIQTNKKHDDHTFINYSDFYDSLAFKTFDWSQILNYPAS